MCICGCSSFKVWSWRCCCVSDLGLLLLKRCHQKEPRGRCCCVYFLNPLLWVFFYPLFWINKWNTQKNPASVLSRLPLYNYCYVYGREKLLSSLAWQAHYFSPFLLCTMFNRNTVAICIPAKLWTRSQTVWLWCQTLCLVQAVLAQSYFVWRPVILLHSLTHTHHLVTDHVCVSDRYLRQVWEGCVRCQPGLPGHGEPLPH